MTGLGGQSLNEGWPVFQVLEHRFKVKGIATQGHPFFTHIFLLNSEVRH